MIFSSPIFLFLFLPLSLALYFLTPRLWRNFTLLFSSIVFYAFGEGQLVLYFLLWTLINYLFGLIIWNYPKKIWLLLAVGLNLGVLIHYKYLFFLVDPFAAPQTVYLPLAISFFALHAISYNIDIYRGTNKAELNLSRFGLYMLMFPHLLAGPIIRYHQIQDKLDPKDRLITLDDFSYGVIRFITGLAKKVLIADTLALIVDEIFAIPPSNLSMTEAWLGALAFSIQIYMDFSGYSDMAVGLGKMFGFTFPENFNYPYMSSSVAEFWRRWHITLSSWLRDYVYIPLAHSWGRNSKVKIYLSLLLTFLLIGLWHGANWTFIIFGAIQGTAIFLESVQNGALVKWMPKILRHGYFIVITLISWVFFRSENVSYAIDYISLMFGFSSPELVYRQVEFFLRNDILLALTIGILISIRLPQMMMYRIVNTFPRLSILELPGLITLLILSIIVIAAQTFQSFIYFRF